MAMIRMHFEHQFSRKQGGFHLKVNLDTDSQRLAFLGASGSGKTLTLQAISGLFRPQRGYIEVGGRVLLDTKAHVCLPARARRIGYLFQDYALFPHMTVRQNIAFPLSGWLRKNAGEEKKVDELLELLELQAVASSYPSFISGGQKQRTALARALATRPDMLLLDEPFSALDPLLRVRVRHECSKILADFSIPTIIITHDPEDVLDFADTVSVYELGQNSVCRGLNTIDAQVEAGNPLLQSLMRVKRLKELAESMPASFGESVAFA